MVSDVFDEALELFLKEIESNPYSGKSSKLQEYHTKHEESQDEP